MYKVWELMRLSPRVMTFVWNVIFTLSNTVQSIRFGSETFQLLVPEDGVKFSERNGSDTIAILFTFYLFSLFFPCK